MSTNEQTVLIDSQVASDSEIESSFDEEMEESSSNCFLYSVGACVAGAAACGLYAACLKPAVKPDGGYTPYGTGYATADVPDTMIVPTKSMGMQVAESTVLSPVASAMLMVAFMVSAVYAYMGNASFAKFFSCGFCLKASGDGEAVFNTKKASGGMLVGAMICFVWTCLNGFYQHTADEEPEEAVSSSGYRFVGLLFTVAGGMVAFLGFHNPLASSSVQQRRKHVMSVGIVAAIFGAITYLLSFTAVRNGVADGSKKVQGRSKASATSSRKVNTE